MRRVHRRYARRDITGTPYEPFLQTWPPEERARIYVSYTQSPELDLKRARRPAAERRCALIQGDKRRYRLISGGVSPRQKKRNVPVFTRRTDYPFIYIAGPARQHRQACARRCGKGGLGQLCRHLSAALADIRKAHRAYGAVQQRRRSEQRDCRDRRDRVLRQHERQRRRYARRSKAY